MSDFNESTPNNVVMLPFARKALQAQGIKDPLNEKKRELFNEWLTHGTVSVLFDARAQGVKVPLEFKQQGDLRLNFCHHFHVPDFNFNEVGVWATLSFDSGEQFCMVPWASVYGIQSAVLNQGAVWFEHFPGDYNQKDVLGTSEELCASLAEDNIDPHEVNMEQADNVIAVDFANKSGSLLS
jgi:stringent starvation protein B